MDPPKIVIAGLVVWIIIIALTSKPAPSVRGAPPVETTHEHPFYRTSEQVDAEIVAEDLSGAELGRWLLDDGQLYGPVGHDGKPLDDEATKLVKVRLAQRCYAPFWAPGLDLGTIAGYRGGSGVEPGTRFNVGLRYSPVRLAYGVVAPDVVAGNQGAGVGVSIYPPRQLGRFWRHWGVGVWEIAPYEGGPIGWCAGLSFSTVGR